MRDANGRFQPGNTFSKGNPFAGKTNMLRAALHRAVTPDDVEQIVKMLVAKAKQGDLEAAKEVLSRVLGRPAQSDVSEAIEELQAKLAELEADRGNFN
jgi:type II secretory pathway predicted ATPase ExeA